MQYIQKILAVAILALAGIAYMKAYAEYDPEKVCAAQTHTSTEACLAQVDLAMSAGW